MAKITVPIKVELNEEKMMPLMKKSFNLGVDEFAKWLVKYKVVPEPAMNELLRDFKGEVGIENI